jgi:hypothetical protein
MSRSIKTYEDLLQEEQRLLQSLKTQEVTIKNDMVGLQEGLKPVGRVFSFFHKMATRDPTGPLANFGIDFGIDLLVRKFILARAGWFTKIFVPFIIKNYSSHIINEEQRVKLSQKIQNLFNKIRPKKSTSTSASPGSAN